MDARSTRRWMYVWIAIGVAIVLVVAGFLIAISSSLYSIADTLDTAQERVRATRNDVQPLPEYIADINDSLAAVERQLRPLPEQARRVVDNLQSIDTTLSAVEGRLNETATLLATTSALLVDTVRALASTERTLDAVARSLGSTVRLTSEIQDELVQAEVVRSSGTGAIWRHVRFLNGGRFVQHPERFDRDDHNHRLGENRRGLDTVEDRTTLIARALAHTNRHLESACEDLPPLASAIPGGEEAPQERPDC